MLRASLSLLVSLGWLVATAQAAPAPRFPQAAQQEVLQGDPQRRSRPCMCQFGVGLRTNLLGLRIGQLLPGDDYGHHSYGEPSAAENDGQIYTCGAGFIDSSHLRVGADWTAHLVVLFDELTFAGGEREFGEDGGSVRLVVRRAARPLSREDILRVAQRAAYERLLWHEVMSWYYHAPKRTFSEQMSSFSPEDAPSNLIGTEVGRRAIELVEASEMAFEDAVDLAMEERLAALAVVQETDDTRRNFAQVDRAQDGGDAAWHDTDVLFWDQKYLYKRNIPASSTVTAWRVPRGAEVGCKRPSRGYVGRVPRTTTRGTLLTELYEWQFTPDRTFFRVESGPDATPESDPRFVHAPLPTVVTSRTLAAAVAQVEAEMRATLGEDFDTP